MVFLFVEGIQILGVELRPAVAKAVSHIALGKVARIQLGSRHAAQPHTPALLIVVADKIEDRAYVELALLALFGGWHIAGQCHLADTFYRLERRQTCQFHLQAVEHGFLKGQLYGPLAVPHTAEYFGGTGAHHMIDSGPENAVGQRLGTIVEPVVAAYRHPVGIKFLQFLVDIQTAEDVLPVRHIVAVVGTGKMLLDGEVAHKVQIHPRRHRHRIARHTVGAVQCNIQLPGETVALLVGGHKRQLHTGHAVHLHGVGNVVVVKSDGHGRRQRAYKMVEHQLDVGIVYFKLSEHGRQALVYAFLPQGLVDTLHAVARHIGAVLARLAAVGLFHHGLAHRNRQNRSGIERGLVDILLQKRQVFPKPVLSKVGVEIVQGQRQLLIHIAAVALLAYQAVAVAVFDGLLGKLHGRIVPTLVAFPPPPFRSHHHLFECLHLGRHLYLHAAFHHPSHKGYFLGLVAHHAQLHFGVALGVGQRETPVHVAAGAYVGTLKTHLHKRQLLSRKSVNHTTLQPCFLHLFRFFVLVGFLHLVGLSHRRCPRHKQQQCHHRYLTPPAAMQPPAEVCPPPFYQQPCVPS